MVAGKAKKKLPFGDGDFTWGWDRWENGGLMVSL
jgi:hypothetical protein